MSANPPYAKGSEPSVQLPPGALPPPMESWPSRRELWRDIRVGVEVVVIVIVALAALWAFNSVSVVPVAHSYRAVIATADNWIHLPVGNNSSAIFESVQAPSACESTSIGIGFPPNDIGSTFVNPPSQGTGATLSGTYSDPNGTPIALEISFASDFCFATNTSGSFVLSTSGTAWPAAITVMSPVPVTVFVNGSYSYLAPLAELL